MNDSDQVKEKRRQLSKAMHAMHVDQRILIDADLASELEKAWAEYDRAIVRAALENGHSA